MTTEKVSEAKAQSDLPGMPQNQFGRSPGARAVARAERPVACNAEFLGTKKYSRELDQAPDFPNPIKVDCG